MDRSCFVRKDTLSIQKETEITFKKNEKSWLSERGNTCEPLSLQHENETNEKTEYTFYSAGLVPAVRYDAGCTDP